MYKILLQTAHLKLLTNCRVLQLADILTNFIHHYIPAK
jgi:hypothetical protein